MTDRQTDGQTDICDCRVAFATEKSAHPNVCVSSTPCGFQILAAVNGMSGVDGKI